VPELLLRLALELLPAVFAPLPDVLERSAVELLPVPLELEPARLAPLLLEELPRPLPEELASLRGEELLEPIPLLEPLPVLEPLAPDAPDEPDSRTSDTVTSGAPWLAGKVTMATPNPFCTPLDDEPLRPDELEPEDEPLRPEEVDELPERPLPEVLERSALELLLPVPLDEVPEAPVPLDELELAPMEVPLPPLCELSRVTSVLPLLLLRGLDDEEDEEPMPPLDDDEPERPPLEVPLVSERRLLLPRLPLVFPLELPDEFTGQLLSNAGLETSPWTIISSLNWSAMAD
jgi:hypothetical protein